MWFDKCHIPAIQAPHRPLCRLKNNFSLSRLLLEKKFFFSFPQALETNGLFGVPADVPAKEPHEDTNVQYIAFWDPASFTDRMCLRSVTVKLDCQVDWLGNQIGDY